MLTTRLRKQIEWHFYNYEADLKLYRQRERDILGESLTVNYERVGSSNGISNPTEGKALRLERLDGEKSWATVVRNTFNAFRFEPEYEVMCKLYIEGIKQKNLIRTKNNPEGIVSESTFYFWRNRWIEVANEWAIKLKLIPNPGIGECV